MITTFTPLTSFLGGMLIGLAAVLLMALNGRILGVTGIVNGLLSRGNLPDWSMRAALVAGMILGPIVFLLTTGRPAEFAVPVPTLAILVGGLIVGIGVSYGGGCTSGHGVCGNARFSRRSIIATCCFMASAFVTVFVTRHVIGGL